MEAGFYNAALAQIDTALARLETACHRFLESYPASQPASQPIGADDSSACGQAMAQLEARHMRLREVVQETLGALSTLIAAQEAGETTMHDGIPATVFAAAPISASEISASEAML